MKKLVMLIAICAVCIAQALTLAEARGKIAQCIQDTKTMTATMKELSAADQVAFVAEVNTAIAGMPGSTEEKVGTIVDVNKAAMLGAAKGNVSTVLAEVYASAPAEALPAITEVFAKELFNRSADASVSYSDEQYKKIATTIMAKIAERVAGVEGGDARAVCAAVMLAKASGETPSADLVEALTAVLPESARNADGLKQINTILGSEGEAKDYETVVEKANPAEPTPEFEAILRLSPTQQMESLMGDIDEGIFHMHATYHAEDSGIFHYDIENLIPPNSDPEGPAENQIPTPQDYVPTEPEGYQGQLI